MGTIMQDYGNTYNWIHVCVYINHLTNYYGSCLGSSEHYKLKNDKKLLRY